MTRANLGGIIITFFNERKQTFLSSSMAEHSAVNRRVVGSSPTWGARNIESESDLVRIFFMPSDTVILKTADGGGLLPSAE